MLNNPQQLFDQPINLSLSHFIIISMAKYKKHKYAIGEPLWAINEIIVYYYINAQNAKSINNKIN